MRVVIAPNAFKGTLSALQAAKAIEAGIKRADRRVECELVPISDGGDGFVDVITHALGLARHRILVRGPSHSPVAADIGLGVRGGTTLAVIESAQAVGLALLPREHLDPMGASTGGVGELLGEARQRGATRFLVGVGGSASSDGGTGMARALGYRFLDEAGHELAEGGGELRRLAHIDSAAFDSWWMLHPAHVACDVTNPLTGLEGAAAVYGPQKGASAEQVSALAAGLQQLADVVRQDLGVDAAALPGSGAAGGLGFGLKVFLGAELERGAETVIATVGLERRLAGADAFFTGEGRLDAQSLSGKVPVVAGRLARAAGVRSLALVGSRGPGWEPAVGDAFDEVVAVNPGAAGPEPSSTAAAAALSAAAEEVLKRLAAI